ncbi:hypothetical protein Poli38472_004772 [Pythium oligandrum]|uniref:Uncharacterized protein n=1 Tax=Pythium oligandrum TaxID=41045 RepID=A0A8K1CB18_PYTOL|nr:hypothetical protein Poli38472_004772 [Pythium oligandrum]|eukprot:TMW59703.1 hypothetical protein Poli38472_004772 [Pythium oligandrum]
MARVGELTSIFSGGANTFPLVRHEYYLLTGTEGEALEALERQPSLFDCIPTKPLELKRIIGTYECTTAFWTM